MFTRALALALCCPLQASADVLVLKDGRIIEERKLERVEAGIRIHFVHGEIVVPNAQVAEVLIEGEVLAPGTDEEKAQSAKGLVRFENKWMSPKSRDDLLAKRLAKRKAELVRLKEHYEWRNRRRETTKNFAFEHTLPPEIFADYRDLMETYFQQFVKDWKIRLPRDHVPLKVCLYTDYERMIQIGGAGWGTLGYYRFVRPRECNFFHERLDPALTEEVMFHETNHYLQHLIDLGFAMPHFPGESLAEYYGASHYDPKTRKITTGLILEGRLVEVQEDLARGEVMTLDKLITTDRGLYEHYTWGWTLVHFLMNDEKLAARFQKFVIGLSQDKDVRRVDFGVDQLKEVENDELRRYFKKCMGLEKDEAWKKLESDWQVYVREKLSLISPRGKELAASVAARSDRPLKAKRLFQEAIDGGTQNPMTFHRFAGLLHSEGEHGRAIELWRKALELDPLAGEYYVGLARAQSAKGDKTEAKRLFALAREVDPDCNELWTLDEEGAEKE